MIFLRRSWRARKIKLSLFLSGEVGGRAYVFLSAEISTVQPDFPLE